MELRVRGLTRDEMNRIDEDATERDMRRNAYVKWQLLSGDPRPMDETERGLLLAAKARRGNMRAIELLMRRVPVAAVGAEEPKASANALAEVIALTNRGGKA